MYSVNRQLYPLTASGLIPSHRLQVNLSILVGFMDPDTGVTEEVADSPVTLLCAGQAGNSCHIPHLFQDVAVLYLPAIGVPFLSHIPVQPDPLIGSHVQAVGKDRVATHVGPERLIVTGNTISTAQQGVRFPKSSVKIMCAVRSSLGEVAFSSRKICFNSL
jgi:hypothetical protein